MTTTTYCPATHIKLNHILGAYVKCTLELYFFTGQFLAPIPRCPSTKSNTHTPLIGPVAAACQLYHPPTLHDFQHSLYFCEYQIHIYKERKPITSVAKNEQTLIGSSFMRGVELADILWLLQGLLLMLKILGTMF